MGEDFILEVAAGDGMLSHWLRECGVNIKATDSMDRHRNHGLQLRSEVEELDGISAIRKYKPRMVVASWIEYGSELDCEILDEDPEYLILIGEHTGGCTGSEKFAGGWEEDSPPAYWIQKGYIQTSLSIDMWNICRTDYDWSSFHPHSHTMLYSLEKEMKETMVKRVKPISIEGYNLSWNLNLLSGPKFTIKCGNCRYTFKERIIMMDYPSVLCPACGAINELNLVVESLAETARR